MRQCLMLIMTNIAVCTVHHIVNDVAIIAQAGGKRHELDIDVNLTGTIVAIGERQLLIVMHSSKL